MKLSKYIAIPTTLFLILWQFGFGNVNLINAAVDTCTWTGAVDGTWSNGGNWSGCDNGGVPENGDSLTFPIAALTTPPVNDMVGLQVNDITFTSGGISLSGNAFSIDGDITASSSGIASISNDMTLLSATNFNALSGGASFLISSDINTNGNDLTINSSASGVGISGVISGTGQLIKNGSSNLNLTAANTYSGATTINAGTVNVSNATSLGSTAAGTTVNSGGTVAISGNIIVDENFTLDGGTLSNASGGNVVNGTITLNSSSTIFQQSTSGVSFTGAISIPAGETLTFDGTGSNNVQVTGVISGLGGIVKDGPDFMLRLDNNNTYDGSTNIFEGGVRISMPNSLGSTLGDTFILTGAWITTTGVGSALTIPEDIALDGDGDGFGVIQQSAATHTYSGALTLLGATSVNALGVGEELIIQNLTGSGPVTKLGPGNLTFNGATANTYTGDFFVDDGNLQLDKPAGTESITGGTLTLDNSAALRIFASNQIDDTTDINMASASTDLFLNNNSEGIDGLTGSGTIDLGSGTLIVGSANATSTFSGTIIGGGGNLTKTGTGTLTLSGVSTYSGTTTVLAGVLIVNGSQPSSPVVVNGGILGGTGLVGITTVNDAILAPGVSGPGILNVDLNLTLNSGSTYRVELNGLTAGTQYDQTISGAGITMNGGTLDVVLGFTPNIGDTFVILQITDSPPPVSGTFAGLPDGAIFAVNGVYFRIDYSAQDVTLTVVSPPLAQTGINVPTAAASVSLVTSLLGLALLSRRYRLK